MIVCNLDIIRLLQILSFGGLLLILCLGIFRSEHALFRSYVVINPFSSDLALVRPPF